MSTTDKLITSQYDQEATASEGYSVGSLNDETHNSAPNSPSPSPGITLNRQFENNPFADRSTRYKFISNKHESILKQFSSTHFHVPTTNQLNNANNLSNLDEAEQRYLNAQQQSNDSSSSSDEGNEDIDVDDTAPLIFEFPYYLNTTKRNLVLMKEHFLQQNRVEALKLAIQTARFLIDDVVLSEPQFYPAIYVLVSKLLDKFGDLVYDRLYSLALYGGDSSVNDQYQHNFIPETEETQSDNRHNNNGSNNYGYNSHRQTQYRTRVASDASQSDSDEKTEGNKGADTVESLPANFRASHCSHLCQIKCGNWFFKISAIRELVPRILIEIALYRSLRYLYPLTELLEYTKVLMQRLRGISNPLICAYVTVFALEQIFKTFGTNSFIYESENEQSKSKNTQTQMDFDMIEDIYLQALNDVLFVFKSMYDTNFMYVECVFYGQMASEDYLNLFNPIFETMFDILKYNKVISSANDLKLFLNQNINPNLLKLIDLNSFLGIKDSDDSSDYALQLDQTQNLYNKNSEQSNKKRRTKRSQQIPIIVYDKDGNCDQNQNNESGGSNNALSDMAKNFQNIETV